MDAETIEYLMSGFTPDARGGQAVRPGLFVIQNGLLNTTFSSLICF